MRRALLILALLAAPAGLFGQSVDRAILLAPNGTLYSVESKVNDDPTINSVRYLILTSQTDQTVIKSSIPASTTGGNNWLPELAFDSDSGTLFVFWLHSQNSILGTNELLFCSFQNGKWNAPSSIEDVPYHFRVNLRVGMTRVVDVPDPVNGGTSQMPGLTVHVAWWDESSSGEVGRYAMLTVDRGVVTDVYLRNLSDFIDGTYPRPFVSADPDSLETLRHPVVFESPEHDVVDIVFGDMPTSSIHRITLKPAVQTRVRIPIGIRDIAYPVPLNKITSDTVLSSISTPPDRLVYYYVTDTAVKYMTYESGAWSDEKSIAVTSDVSADAAVAALRRLVRGD